MRCADCTRGKVDCETCHQAKKLACWLEIRSDLRQDVQLTPEGAATLPFPWCRRGASVADDQLALDARIVDKVTRTRPLAATELPATVPQEWRSEHGPRLQAHVEPGERVRSQSFTFLSVPFASVTYAVLGEQHAVALEGLRMLAPPVTAPAAEPFARRARMLGRLALAFAALPVAIGAIYAARGEYFTSGRATGLVAGVAIAAAATAALAYAALWNVTLGRRRARTWAMAAIAPVTIASVLAAIAEPRLDRARDLLDAGRLLPPRLACERGAPAAGSGRAKDPRAVASMPRSPRVERRRGRPTVPPKLRWSDLRDPECCRPGASRASQAARSRWQSASALAWPRSKRV